MRMTFRYRAKVWAVVIDRDGSTILITKLLAGWWQSLVDLVAEHGPDLLVKALIFCFIIYKFYSIIFSTIKFR